jgi:hypothetical protein
VIDDLRHHFVTRLQLPADAAAWLLDLWRVIQVWDDVADGDPIDRAALDDAILTSLVGLPSNKFYLANAAHLAPVLALAVAKWKASDDAERAKQADERSFVWRASYYDVVLMVVMLCHGAAAALAVSRDVMHLYGEKFAAYRKDFK